MPTTKTITLYQFDELPTERAKERARNWYRESLDSSDFDSTIEDFVTIAEAMGVTFKTHSVRLHGGGTRQDPNVYWSGFGSQGDGACFEGTFTLTGKAGEAIREHAPQDEKLHAIADALDVVAAKYPDGLSGTIHRPYDTRYSHANTMFVEIVRDEDDDDLCGNAAEQDKTQDLFRDLANWLYKALDEQNDYLYSAESVDESIMANEYTFREDGDRED
jgi:hypothetical protein